MLSPCILIESPRCAVLRPLGPQKRVEGLEFGLGCRVWGLGFRVWGLGLRVWGLGFRVWGLGFRVRGLGLGFGA